MDRNKNTVDDFNTIIQGNNGQKYIDNNFPYNDALYWKDAGENGRDMAQLEDWIEWKRISDGSGYSFYGPNGKASINPQDLNQGYIGNCWIIAAISAMAEVPGRVDNLFVNDELNDIGIYAAKQYALGVPFTQIVDDYLPYNGENTIFTGLGKDGSIWGAIMEKIFAKRYGNYEHTVGGWMYAAVSAMNGSPWANHYHGGLSDDQVWSVLKTHDLDTDIMTAASHFCGSHDETNENGVACSHAYTVISCGEFDGPNGKVRLVKVRNPWGMEEYAGPYSDSSNLWTPELREAVNDELGDCKENNEGIFFMDIASYRTNFQLTTINQDTSNWKLDYFLKLNDQSTNTISQEDCQDCVKHTLTVKNEGPAQDVHIGAHIWQDRTYGWYNYECYDAMQGQPHRIWDITGGMDSEDTNYLFDTGDGSAWMQPIRMGENETREIGVLFDWKRENVVKDWSVTAWGTKHEVVVRHEDYPEVKTDKMPEHTDNKDGVTPPQPIPDEGGDDGGDGGDNGNCQSTNNGATDPFGDGCDAYVGNPEWCGNYDDEDFKSKEMCCACGGGNREEEGGDDEEQDEDEDDVPIPDEDEEADDGECEDTNNGAKDEFGDGCAAYNDNIDWCGNYDTAEFNSKEMCCACGGGNKGGDGDDGDDGTIPDEEENDDDEVPIPDEEEGECQDTNNGAKDEFGDGCAAYNDNIDWCGGYDTAEFKSKEMCCACGGGNKGGDGDDGDDSDEIPIPDEEEGECQDTNNGAKDEFGDGCAAYNDNIDWCGNYDTAEFKSKEMCCACGGGSNGGDGDDGTIPDEEEDDGTDPDENDGEDMTPEEEAKMYFDMYNIMTEGDSANVLCLEEFQTAFITLCYQCPWDNAQRMLTFFDEDGDGCLSLEEFTELYKHMNDESLVPDEDDKDDGTIPDETGECQDTNNGAKDEFGDGCAAYNDNIDWCGNYDTAEFNSKEMCCACGGGSNGGDGDDGTIPDEEEDDGTDPDENDGEDMTPEEEALMYFDMYNTMMEGDSANVLCLEEFQAFFVT